MKSYRVDWLKATHAAQVAALERRVYPRDYRAGRASIAEDLLAAERDNTNLSMGLFHDDRLVGFLLAFHERRRSDICTYLDVTPPPGIDLSGPGIYLNDFVVHPAHRGAGPMLGLRLAHVVRTRDQLRDLPVDTFSSASMADTWAIKARFLARHSIKLVERQRLDNKAGGEQLEWLVFRHVAPRVPSAHADLAARLKRRRVVPAPQNAAQASTAEVGFYDSVVDWELLKPFWNELLQRTPGGTVFQTFEYLSIWWALLGLKNQLLIAVVLVEGVPVAIAPMQTTPRKWLGKALRCLTFIGHPSEVDRNTVLAAAQGDWAVSALAAFLMDCRDLWDCVSLYEQGADSAFLARFDTALRASGHIVTSVPGPQCASIRIEGSWDDFLAAKPKAFRKSVRRKCTETVRLESAGAPDMHHAALARYRAIEGRSWKTGAGLGVAKSSAHWYFNDQIVRAFATFDATCFRFLTVDDKDAAATYGLRWNHTYYSLHIAHDEAYAAHSPGFVLTALELQSAFSEAHCTTFDFLGGFMTNKRTWATHITPTVALFAHRRGIPGQLFHTLYFSVRPRLRRMLLRLKLLDRAVALKQSLVRLWPRGSA